MKAWKATAAVLVCFLIVAVDQALAGVSISIGEPGFYGRIDIGGYPAPRLLSPEPVIIHRAGPQYPPIYLRVPPYHAKRWSRYCHEYNACGRPVYFIEDGWYRNVYVPRYREHHHHHKSPYRQPYVVPSPPQHDDGYHRRSEPQAPPQQGHGHQRHDEDRWYPDKRYR